MCIVLVAKCPVLGQLKNGIITLVTLRNGGEVEIKCLTAEMGNGVTVNRFVEVCDSIFTITGFHVTLR